MLVTPKCRYLLPLNSEQPSTGGFKTTTKLDYKLVKDILCYARLKANARL